MESAMIRLGWASAAVIVIGVSLSVACTVSTSPDEVKTESKTESTELKYSLRYNGCDTGTHSFATKEAYCRALRDDALNRGCARAMREDLYESSGCASLP